VNIYSSVGCYVCFVLLRDSGFAAAGKNPSYA
jgi:hypothetical protein